MANIRSKKKTTVEKGFTVTTSTTDLHSNSLQPSNIHSAYSSNEKIEHNKILRRYSIDDNGGGYMGL